MSDSASTIDWAAHADGVRRLARSLVVDDDAADDVAQEALRLAIERRPPPERLGDWLRAATRHIARRLARSGRRRASRERRVARREALPSAADAVLRVAEQSRLLATVMRLAEPQRTAIVLRFFENLPPREIAARLGVPVETVRSRTKRGLAALRDELREAHGGDDREWRLALAPLLAFESKRSALAIGGWVMATKAKIAAVVIALLLCVLGLWRIAGLRTDPDVAGTPRAVATAPRSSKPSQSSPMASEGTATVASTGSGGLAAPGGWRVAGRVVDEAGRPLAGARIRLDSPDEFSELAGEPAARSDDVGRFEVLAPASARVVRVVAEADGRRLDWCDVLESRPRDVELRLELVRALPFVVRDAETGEPIVGVAVNSLAARDGVVSRQHATSDVEGRVVVTDPGLGDYWDVTQLQFSKLGWEPTRRDARWISFHRGTFDRPTEIDLRRSEGLLVEVVDADTNQPLAGARVTGWSGRDGASVFGTGAGRSRIGAASLGDAVTGDDGVATLPAALPNEPACVVARASGRFGLTCSSSRSRTCRIALRPTRVVRGTVVDENGEPMAGAIVETSMLSLLGQDDLSPGTPLPTIPSAAEGELATRVDVNGHFAFQSLPRLSDRPWSVTASVERRRGSVRVDDAPGDANLTIRLSPADPSFDVRVRDESGAPIEAALVHLALLYPGDRTDSEGIARLDRGLTPENFPRTLVVEAPGFAVMRTEIRGYSDPGVPLDVVLEPESTLEGTVVDSRGAPANAHVRAVAVDVDPAQIRSIGLDDARLLGEAETSDDGRFRIDRLPAVACRVQASQIRVDETVFSPPADAHPREPIVLRLTAPSAAVGTSRLEGAVFDGAGHRVTNYWIRLRQGQRLLAANTAAWHFVFDDVPAGDYTVEITLPQSNETTRLPLVVRDGEDQVGLRFVLAESAMLSGRLIVEGDVDLADLDVDAIDVASQFSRGSARTDAQGAFEIPNLPAGEYVLRLSARGDGRPSLQAADGRFVLADGHRLERTFACAPVARVVIVVDDERFATDEECARQPLLATSQRSQFSLIEVRDSAGKRRYSVDEVRRGRHALGAAVPLGDYVLHVTSPAFDATDIAVHVERASDVVLRLDLPPTATDVHSCLARMDVEK